jgi:hypothetical protein
VTGLEVTEARPGFAEVVAVAVDGCPRSPEHCAWTSGLMTCMPTLFGLQAAHVEHEECQVMGAERCVYRVRWQAAGEERPSDCAGEIIALRRQLDAMRDRLHVS